MKFGLVGEQLSYSYSKMIHEMLGRYDYHLFNVAKNDFKRFATNREWDGLNVTIPYKKEIIPFLDELDPIAKEIGSVNTIYFKNGRLHGTNTDYDGFLFMLKATGISLKNEKVLILGTGGASLMVEQVAKDMGAKWIKIAGRKGPITYNALPSDATVLINTTPVGTYPNNGKTPTSLKQFSSLIGVFDLIYNPFKTALLLEAEALDLKFSDGLPMLVAQATAAAKHFTNGKDFNGENEKIINILRKKMNNIVLVGMPGCGKSFLGKALAETLSMEFIDTDLIIEHEENLSPEEIINKKGEEYFRRVESRVIEKVTKEHGQIIATGGGSVLCPKNLINFRQNGPVIFIERDLNCLEISGRPLSIDLNFLYQKRLPLYKSCSDFSIYNDKPFKETLTEILATLF